MTVDELRKKHPIFRYTKAWHQVVDDRLTFFAQFEVEPEISFTTQVSFPSIADIPKELLTKKQLLDQIALYIGFGEIPSYWKATCSPNIEIDAGPIKDEHLDFLHTLLKEGLGEFYFVNDIDSFIDDTFVSITTTEQNQNQAQNYIELPKQDTQNYLLPLGGGKDSLVTLEVLQEFQKNQGGNQGNLGILILEPASPAAQKIADYSGLQTIIAQRVIDPKILELNNQGYLNGHTPFSAYLSVLSSFAAILYGYSDVVLSNERSANEGNLQFHGMEINHQWSKSEEYEATFRNLSTHYFPFAMPSYYSLLRPLYELQIAALFADSYRDNSEILTTFKSCNRGQKKGVWCGECPKCLFAYLLLGPFLSPTQLKDIFGQNLLEKEPLKQTATNLLGEGSNKPLECVGMYQETLVAAYLTIQRWYSHDSGAPLPVVLQHISETILSQHLDLDHQARQLLQGWNQDHHAPADLAQWLKESVNRVTADVLNQPFLQQGTTKKESEH